jgi:HK97 gp10 family phage protein
MAEMQGRAKALAKLRRIPVVVRADLKAAIRAEAERVSEMQRRLVPEDSGDLKRSIKVAFGNVALASSAALASGGGQGDPDLTATLLAGDARAFYARFVEFGTAAHEQGGRFKGAQHPGTTPRPFFFGPFRANRSRIKRKIGQAVRLAAIKVAKG